MADGFRVEPAVLSEAGAQFAGLSDVLSGLDLSGPLAQVAAALPGSGTAGAADGLSTDVTSARSAVAFAVARMADSAVQCADNYTGADAHHASVFRTAMGSLSPAGPTRRLSGL